jgi:hypothetical protein
MKKLSKKKITDRAVLATDASIILILQHAGILIRLTEKNICHRMLM